MTGPMSGDSSAADVLARVCVTLAGLSPIAVGPPPSLVDAVDTLGIDLAPSTVSTASTVLWGLGSLTLLLVAAPFHGVDATVAAAALIGGLFVGSLPMAILVLPAARRRAALRGALPAFVCRVALGMRLTPTLEAGVASAFTVTDPLTDRVRRRRGRPATDVIDDTVTDLGPTADRARGLLVAATTATDHDALLDRAVHVTLTGVGDHARRYASEISGPVTAIYAFGVVLPLALVGILPVVPVAGLSIPTRWLAFVLDLVLPSTILTGTGWLLATRPRIDPSPSLHRDNLELGPVPRVALLSLAGVLAGVVVSHALASWTRLVLPVAWGLGAALLARYNPALAAVEDAVAVSRAVPDLLSLVGDAMADGAPPEHAVEAAGDVPGRAGEIATDAATVRRRLGVSVSESLAGEHGPLNVVDDERARTVAGLVAVAATAGKPGGRALSRFAGHLDDLQEIDRKLRADLAATTDSLAQTAAVYAPAIGGVTVALSSGIDADAAALPATPGALPLVVGGYVLALAAVLPAMATALAAGWSRVRVGVRVGRALVLAGGTYPVVARLAGVLL